MKNPLSVERLVRYYSYFRVGFGKYLSYPLSIFQTITVGYLYVTDHLPFFALHFSSFVILAVLILVPLGIYLGFFDMKQSIIFSTENVLVTESNSQAVHMNRLSMDALEKLFEVHGLVLTGEWQNVHKYWIELDKKKKWRPPV